MFPLLSTDAIASVADIIGRTARVVPRPSPWSTRVTRSRSVNSTAAPTRSPRLAVGRRRSTGPRRLVEKNGPEYFEGGVRHRQARRDQRRPSTGASTADEIRTSSTMRQAKVVVVGPSSCADRAYRTRARHRHHDRGAPRSRSLATTRLGSPPNRQTTPASLTSRRHRFHHFHVRDDRIPKGR